MIDATIRVQSATRRFRSRRGESILAVDNLSFEVRPGEIFGLLGPNGAGKTTTIHLITGLLRRDSGDVHVLGFDPAREARQVRRTIGYVPQETNVYLDLNAVDNLWHHAALYCPDLSVVKGRIEALLHLMDLWDRRRDPVKTFSGGMKRRLALARALLHDPPIILFDEPTLGVDVQARHVLWDHIRARQAEGKTFVVSTNDMAEAEALCDRLVIIDHGQAIALDTPDALKAALGRDIVTVRTTPDIADPAALFAGLGVQAVTRLEGGGLRLEVSDAESIAGELFARAASGHRLESVRIARPTLDDVFLHHTGRGLRE
ncbi:MAG: ATP-binding cassette domain-containing protein [Anaerolineae bacterium]|nr:ATP-binding cassette domain-containing protein [Anaerolineae bacterium]